MRVVLQRVREASVTVSDQVVGAISAGLVVLVGVTHGDGEREAETLAAKIANLRIFEDAAGKMNLSALDTRAAILVIPQFTLYADARKGRRPDFIRAAPPEVADALIEKFIAHLRAAGVSVATGQFRAHMLVKILNDGPVTIVLDSAQT
jgi:D-tyrosyl-tRNA(Tyr) deacylase